MSSYEEGDSQDESKMARLLEQEERRRLREARQKKRKEIVLPFNPIRYLAQSMKQTKNIALRQSRLKD